MGQGRESERYARSFYRAQYLNSLHCMFLSHFNVLKNTAILDKKKMSSVWTTRGPKLTMTVPREALGPRGSRTTKKKKKTRAPLSKILRLRPKGPKNAMVATFRLQLRRRPRKWRPQLVEHFRLLLPTRLQQQKKMKVCLPRLRTPCFLQISLTAKKFLNNKTWDTTVNIVNFS